MEIGNNRNEGNEINNETIEGKVNEIPDTSQVSDSENLKVNTKKKKKKGGFFKHFFATLGCLALLVAVLGLVVFLGNEKLGFFNLKTSTPKISNTSVVSANEGLTLAKASNSKNDSDEDSDDSDNVKSVSTSSGVIVTDVSDLVEEVMPSIVAITSTQIAQSGADDFWNEFFYGYGSGDGTYESEGAGSGFIISQTDDELLIVTNNHVIEGADSLQVQFIDEETVDANVKGTDADLDIAVISVKTSDLKDSTLEQIKIATIGDSDSLKVGDGTIAIGNALGYGQSVTTGVVSALNREVQYEDDTKRTLIQTDAAINPGNSGGALLNMYGEVIGINAAKYSSSSVEGMGFAIPISSVEDVIEDLMNQKTKEKVDEKEQGYLGIKGRDITSDIAEGYDMPEGVYIVELTDDSGAEKAGIQEKDIIVKLEGTKISSMEELQNELKYYKSGEKVTVTVKRQEGNKYVEKEIEVTLQDSVE